MRAARKTRAHHRILAETHINDDDRRNQRQPANLVMRMQHGEKMIARGQRFRTALAAIIQAYQRINHDGDGICGNRIGQHRLDMRPNIGTGDGGGEVGGIRER